MELTPQMLLRSKTVNLERLAVFLGIDLTRAPKDVRRHRWLVARILEEINYQPARMY